VRVLRQYIAVSILKGVGIVLGALLAIGSVAGLVGQLGSVGDGDYGLQAALTYVVLRIPRMVVEMLPAAALIGSLLSLGQMAVHRELIVMRASGVSNVRLLSAVGSAGVVLALVMVLLGESIAPSLGAYAREMRAQAMHDDVDMADGQTAWLRSGDLIISLRRQTSDTGFRSGVVLFELGANRELRQMARAESADADAANRWVLANYAQTEFGPDGITSHTASETIQDYGLSPDLVRLSEVRHDLLDTTRLKRYIEYLHANDMNADRYLTAYWARIADVIAVFVMTALALPFVFGGLRSAGAGARLLVGLVIGLGYYAAGQLLVNTSEVFAIDPRIVAFAPVALLCAITVAAYSRMR
jgi:lipopolysaccharide export system permease protein